MRLISKTVLGVFLLTSFLSSCENDPVISIDGPPLPVIYGVFDNKDTVHYIRIGKTFGAEMNPAESAMFYDSITFVDPKINVKITKKWRKDTISLEIRKVTDIPKEEGFFHFPYQQLYSFNYDFGYPDEFEGHVTVTADIPGLPTAKARIYMVHIDRDSFSTPKFAQQYVYLTKESPFRAHWFGNPWNEIDVTFGFEENLGPFGIRTKEVHIQNTNAFISPYPKYRQLNITYEEFIREVLQQIGQNDSVKETYLGYISIHINGGDHNMSQYIQYYDGFTDYNYQGFSNIENAYGLIASRTSIYIDSMQFDRATKHLLWSENRLKVLKIVKR